MRISTYTIVVIRTPAQIALNYSLKYSKYLVTALPEYTDMFNNAEYIEKSNVIK